MAKVAESGYILLSGSFAFEDISYDGYRINLFLYTSCASLCVPFSHISFMLFFLVLTLSQMQELAAVGKRIGHQSAFVQKDKSVDFAGLLFSVNVGHHIFRKESELIPY